MVASFGEEYGLNFLGKAHAQREANLCAKTTLVPHMEHNTLPENIHSKNIYIKGDNLEALRHLQKTHKGKIHCIYIDPPYNTGSQDFAYADTFGYSKEDLVHMGLSESHAQHILDNTSSSHLSHSAWLAFMWPRLSLAKILLHEQGNIFISIDEHELAHLKLLCDEIFGEENFVGQWNWFKSATPSNLSHKIKRNVEYILCYEKQRHALRYAGIKKKSASNNGLMNQSNAVSVLTFPPHVVSTGLADAIYKKGAYGTKNYAIELLEDTQVDKGYFVQEVHLRGKFKWRQEKLHKEIAKGTQLSIKTVAFSPSYEKKAYAPEVPPNVIDAKVFVDTAENAGKALKELFGNVNVFPYPKPASLLQYLISFVDNPQGIILDFFAGSGSTAEGVMRLNAADNGQRSYILVQQDAPCKAHSEAFKAGYASICDIGIERIKRSAKKIQSETEASIDYNFKIFSLESNEA